MLSTIHILVWISLEYSSESYLGKKKCFERRNKKEADPEKKKILNSGQYKSNNFFFPTSQMQDENPSANLHLLVKLLMKTTMSELTQS